MDDSWSLLEARARGVTDDRRLALVLPGGGMRATWQMAALAELQHRGLDRHIDLIVGSSAGAINGCYLASGQAEAAVLVYTDVLPRPKFVNPARLWKVMDVDWLVDHVMQRHIPLDVDALRTDAIPVWTIATDVETGDAIRFDQHHPQLFDTLRATAALPLLYGRTPTVAGRRYVDGGLAAPIPWEQAVELGATDLLVLVPSPSGTRWQPPGPRTDRMFERFSAWRSPAAGAEMYRQCSVRFDQGMQVAENVVCPEGVQITSLFPSDAGRLCGRATLSRSTLAASARMGRRDLAAAVAARTAVPSA